MRTQKLLDFNFALYEGLLFRNLATQWCSHRYRTIGYSYTYRIYVFQISQYIALCPQTVPIAQMCSDDCSMQGGTFGGWVSQINAALCNASRYRLGKPTCRRTTRTNFIVKFGFLGLRGYYEESICTDCFAQTFCTDFCTDFLHGLFARNFRTDLLH